MPRLVLFHAPIVALSAHETHLNDLLFDNALALNELRSLLRSMIVRKVHALQVLMFLQRCNVYDMERTIALRHSRN